MKYKLVLFDFDGTLMDTSSGIFYCCRSVMKANGFYVDPNADLRHFIGPPLMDCFRNTFNIQDNAVLEKLCQDYRKLYITEGTIRAEFYPGILELLADIQKSGAHTGIASMKHENIIDSMCKYFKFNHLIDCFKGQLSEATIEKQDIIKALCKEYGFNVNECVLVGDTEYDRLGAVNAGCDSILVSYGFGYKPGDKGTVDSVEEVRRKIFE